jgi:predicted 2-oxoglutarate/Fe(II)-dependent dioxygenase YbiX
MAEATALRGWVYLFPIYIEPAFLDSAACERVRRAMDVGVAEQAEVLGGTIERRDELRRVMSIEPEGSVIRDVEERLETRRDAIARFFGVDLSEREGSGFLRYPPGGFYTPHRDRAAAASWPGAARRAVAVVIFLNGSLDGEPGGEFRGGTLRLFVNDDVVDVEPRQGLLIAFSSDLLHEVTEVREGTRDAVVDWFYGA